MNKYRYMEGAKILGFMAILLYIYVAMYVGIVVSVVAIEKKFAELVPDHYLVMPFEEINSCCLHLELMISKTNGSN